MIFSTLKSLLLCLPAMRTLTEQNGVWFTLTSFGLEQKVNVTQPENRWVAAFALHALSVRLSYRS